MSCGEHSPSRTPYPSNTGSSAHSAVTYPSDIVTLSKPAAPSSPNRTPREYVWPKTLRQPMRPPKLVYLDMLHWISLAKANSGHPEGPQYAEALSAILEAVDKGVAVFPISDTTYMEVSRIGSYRQRRDLRNVIERVSRFQVVTSRVAIANHEVEALLDRIVGPSPDPVNGMDYLDWGVARAFGMVGGFRVKNTDTGEDVTDDAALAYPDGAQAFYNRMAQAELHLNRKTLDGPTPEEEPGLRAEGWNPAAGYEVAARRAVQELEQVDRLNEDPTWRGERLRDVIAAREVAIEINRMFYEGLASRGVTVDDVLSEDDIDRTRRFFDSMPSFDVSVTLKAAYHRNPAHTWKPNDIHDIDALASTVPYCDIVVTDKEAASHLIQTGLADRFGTIVLARLDDLIAHLHVSERSP
jgi:hypothetical protein